MITAAKLFLYLVAGSIAHPSLQVLVRQYQVGVYLVSVS